jgi:peroxiredoxin
VAAIVTTSREKMRRYIEETGLPFDVLIDERRDTIRAYGVWHRISYDAWNMARPAAFLIDPDATIRASWIGSNQTQFPAAEEILAALSMPNAEC